MTKRFIGSMVLASVFFILLGSAELQAQGVGATPIAQRQIPYSITKPGSYYLTGNLITNNANITVIDVCCNDVVIDLNGFAIIGPGKDSGRNSFGINNVGSDVVVCNGSVRGFGNVGVHLTANNNKAENLRVSECSHEIFVGSNGMIKGCQIQNCFAGINTDHGCRVENNNVQECSLGIYTFGGATPDGGVLVIGNNCRLCGWRGIYVPGAGCRIEGNTIALCGIAIDLDEGSDNLFSRNFLQGNTTNLVGESDDIDGGSIDLSLSNIIR